jgi:uncharacterized protein YcbK (DUF882 family)
LTPESRRAFTLPISRSTSRCVSGLLFSVLLASCTAVPNDPSLGLAPSPAYNGGTFATSSGMAVDDGAVQSLAAEQDQQIRAVAAQPSEGDAGGAQTASAVPTPFAPTPAGDPIETMIASAPSDAQAPDLATATLTVRREQPAPVVQAPIAATEQPEPQPAPQAVAAIEPSTTTSRLPNASIENRLNASHGEGETHVRPNQAAAQASTNRGKQGFLSAFFSANEAHAAPAAARETATSPMIEAKAVKPLVASESAKPLVQMAAVAPREQTARSGDAGALPGVRTTALFEITRKSGLDDDSDVDLHEGDESPVRVASAAGLARLAPNGLLKQHDDVDVSCMKPALVRVLDTLERHYGKKPVITSGYRDPARNKRARGARNSLHMFCAAADVQIEGISKAELANYVRAMPGRGGVGTYCHTDSVHIDIGPERDWNWRCRRRK